MKMNRKGMTLIEVTIALAIFGIVVLATSSVFMYALRSYQVGIEQNKEQFDVRLVSDVITSEVRNCLTIDLLDTGDATNTASMLYIYEDSGNLQYKDVDLGTIKAYTDERIASMDFAITQSAGGEFFLEFKVVGTGGYTITSSILLNNISAAVVESNKEIIEFTKP